MSGDSLRVWRERDVALAPLHFFQTMDPSVNSLGPKCCSQPIGSLDSFGLFMTLL